MSNSPHIEIFVDGSATYDGSAEPKRGVKGDTFCSYVIIDGNGVLEEKCIPLGKGTINQAEYVAIIYALCRAKDLNMRNITIFSDSSVVVHIVNERENIKSSKIKGADEWTPKVHSFIDRHFDKCKVEWIPRAHNRLADRVLRTYHREAHRTGIIDISL